MTLEGCGDYIGADSLAFLSVDGIYRAMGETAATRRGRSSPTTASPATTRRRLPIWTASGDRMRQLALLAEAG